MTHRSLDLSTLATLIESLCPQCNPQQQQLSTTTCINTHCDINCRGNDHDPIRIRTLAAFCLTSRWANALATPHLYHRPTCTSWPLLARTLILRPDLGARVKYLSTRVWYAGTDASPPEVLSYWEEMVEAFAEDGEEVDPDGLNTTNASVDLVVRLCPNLEELHAVLDSEQAFASAQPGSLPLLRTLAVAYWDTEMGLDLSGVGPLADAAPNLSKIICSQVAGAEELHCRFPNVTHVHLNNSAMGPDCLRNILRACPRLESLEFDAGGCMVGDEQFTPLEAQAAIVELAPQLKSLSLDFGYADSLDHELFEDQWLMSSVATLAGLETLDLDSKCLVAHIAGIGQGPLAGPGAMALVDLLPPSIREVRVQQSCSGPDVAGLAHSLVRLAEVAPERFPRLAKVVIKGTELAGVKAAGPRFEEAGVEFRVEGGSGLVNASAWENSSDSED